MTDVAPNPHSDHDNPPDEPSRDQTTEAVPDPADTAHPTGEKQATENAENESPG